MKLRLGADSLWLRWPSRGCCVTEESLRRWLEPGAWNNSITRLMLSIGSNSLLRNWLKSIAMRKMRELIFGRMLAN